jgi:hypothetical protein
MKNIHILPTDKPSRLHIDHSGLFFSPKYQLSSNINSIVQGRNIYITSDEEIKEGDWAMSIYKGLIKVSDSELKIKSYVHYFFTKIILTTDSDLINDGIQAIDDEFLEWFVKNSSCEFVEVEKWTDYKLENDKEIPFFSYKIIIPKEEPKQTDENGKPIIYWGGKQELPIVNGSYGCTIQTNKQETLEKTAEKWVFETNSHKWSNNDDTAGDNHYSFKNGVKWQQERSYSEEDLKQAFIDGSNNPIEVDDAYGTEFLKYMDNWFEQFKKK